MLSILIPVYNLSCFPLVHALLDQIEKNKLTCEIICIDDASTKNIPENIKLQKQTSVNFVKLSKNIGRSRIRNKLVEKATFNWLLFLDADTLPVHKDFLTTYVKFINNSNASIVFGGLAYRKEDIVDNAHLRYIYGKKRESNSAETRSLRPYISLLFSNTLVKKSIFNKVQFNSNIIKYGHEDSLFAQDLKKHKISVTHIDNPVFHTGLESDKIFINKTKAAIENLWELYKLGLISPKENKLLTFFLKVKTFFIRAILAKIFDTFHVLIEKKLSSKKASLLLFDLYKLGYLCSVSIRK